MIQARALPRRCSRIFLAAAWTFHHYRGVGADVALDHGIDDPAHVFWIIVRTAKTANARSVEDSTTDIHADAVRTALKLGEPAEDHQITDLVLGAAEDHNRAIRLRGNPWLLQASLVNEPQVARPLTPTWVSFSGGSDGQVQTDTEAHRPLSSRRRLPPRARRSPTSSNEYSYSTGPSNGSLASNVVTTTRLPCSRTEATRMASAFGRGGSAKAARRCLATTSKLQNLSSRASYAA